METYKVTACYYTYVTATIDAESEEKAYELAREMDEGSFKQSGELGDWHINDIQELESEA